MSEDWSGCSNVNLANCIQFNEAKISEINEK